MKGKLFLLHWHNEEAEELAALLRRSGWAVDIETEDGAQALKRIRENPPDAVLIYLSRLPSHGRETARALRSTKVTGQLPIIFVNGVKDKVKQVQAVVPDAIYTTSAMLEAVLDQTLIKEEIE